jgi:hypothetical protein
MLVVGEDQLLLETVVVLVVLEAAEQELQMVEV